MSNVKLGYLCESCRFFVCRAVSGSVPDVAEAGPDMSRFPNQYHLLLGSACKSASSNYRSLPMAT